jgi:hypothetical protein
MNWINKILYPYNGYEDVPLNDSVSLFWNQTIFHNTEVKKLYQQYLRRAGHCPVCNDFLFIDITQEDNTFYKVVKYCISHKCNYSENISSEFNQKLGLTKPAYNKQDTNIKNPPSHYYGLEIEQGQYNKVLEPLYCTGTLKKSFHNEIQRNAQGKKHTINKKLIKFQKVKKLPPAKNYGNIIFICKGNEFISIKNDNNYTWQLIGRNITPHIYKY